MCIWFVSRHPGAIAWAKTRKLPVERWASHLDLADVAAGDVVIGTLPVHLAADVCARGARFFYLAFSMPAALRGQELTEHDLAALDARITEFKVVQCNADDNIVNEFSSIL